MPRWLCPNCVHPVPRRAKACDRCMTDLRQNPPVKGPKERWSSRRLRSAWAVWLLACLFFLGFASLARTDPQLAKAYVATLAIAVLGGWVLILLVKVGEEGWTEALAFMYRIRWRFLGDDPLDQWRLVLTGTALVGVAYFLFIIKPAHPPGTGLVPW